jgi:hypothetical protein
MGRPPDNGPADYHMHCSVTCHSTCVGSNALFHESRSDLWVSATPSVTHTRVLVNLTQSIVPLYGEVAFCHGLEHFGVFGGQQLVLT